MEHIIKIIAFYICVLPLSAWSINGPDVQQIGLLDDVNMHLQQDLDPLDAAYVAMERAVSQRPQRAVNECLAHCFRALTCACIALGSLGIGTQIIFIEKNN